SGTAVVGMQGDDDGSPGHAPALVGTAGNDVLFGYAGNDVLDGAGGADLMAGGIGNDLYRGGSSSDRGIENNNEGMATALRTVARLMPANVEALYMIGTGLTGTGSGGNDILLSDGGANRLVGLGGNDIYYVRHVGDAVTEVANEGADTVVATVDFAMPANVE